MLQSQSGWEWEVLDLLHIKTPVCLFKTCQFGKLTFLYFVLCFLLSSVFSHPRAPTLEKTPLFTLQLSTTPTCQCLHPRIHWQVTEFEIPSLGFHYFSAYGCSVLLFPIHCWLWLSCLQLLILANESSIILILLLGGMPFPLQQSDLHPIFWNAPWTNELHRGIEFSKESPEKEPCSLGVMTDFRSGTGNTVK